MLALTTALFLSILPVNGEIAFIAHTGETSRLCLYDIATQSVTELGPGQHDRAPRWAPDGSAIVFTTLVEGQRQIAIARPEDRQVEILNNGKPLNRLPRWEINGKRIAYETGPFPESTISVYDLTTNTETTWGGGAKGLMRPVWTVTRDFINSRFINLDIDIVEAGTEQARMILAVQAILPETSGQWTTRLVALTETEVFPLDQWVYDFPDGTYLEWSVELGDKDHALAYESNDGGDRELFIALEGKVFDVSNHREADWNPVWSPDAKWIAYETIRDQRRAVYRAHRESGRSLPILQSGSADFFSPAWHPDSQSLVVLRDKSGFVNMLLTNEDGSERVILETPYTNISDPQWRPR